MTIRQQNTDGTGPLTYADAGVDIDAGNALVERIKPMAARTKRPGVASGLGGFGGLFDLKACGFSDPVLVAATDGVGTKLKIALETGLHDTVGIDLVAMCVNDLVVQGAEPLFFLDYYACGALSVDVAARVIDGIARGCEDAGCALIGGETAEMPGMYAADDYDLAGFAVGAVERARILPRNDVMERDVVLGLASSGIHSNGFSLVRKILDKNKLSYSSPAPEGGTLGEWLMRPTRLYVRSCLAALRKHSGIKALAHITGGGLLENIPRVLQENLGIRVFHNALTPSPVFVWLQQRGGIDWQEMYRTFNCGIGMVMIVRPEEADAVMRTLEEAGETVCRLGEVIAHTPGSERVQISAPAL